jgi:hypothetical protein
MMRIENLLKSWDEFTCFYDRYERENFAYPEEGKRCAEVLVNEFEGRRFKNNPGKSRTFLFANFDRKLKKVFPFKYPHPVKSFLLKTYIALTNNIKRMQKSDPTQPLYVQEAFHPKRSDKQENPIP